MDPGVVDGVRCVKRNGRLFFMKPCSICSKDIVMSEEIFLSGSNTMHETCREIEQSAIEQSAKRRKLNEAEDAGSDKASSSEAEHIEQ